MEKPVLADMNLTVTQRMWKRRRARWASWRSQNNTGIRSERNTRSQLTWEQAVQQGKETQFLKREGETD